MVLFDRHPRYALQSANSCRFRRFAFGTARTISSLHPPLVNQRSLAGRNSVLKPSAVPPRTALIRGGGGGQISGAHRRRTGGTGSYAKLSVFLKQKTHICGRKPQDDPWAQG